LLFGKVSFLSSMYVKTLSRFLKHIQWFNSTHMSHDTVEVIARVMNTLWFDECGWLNIKLEKYILYDGPSIC
jgi:hypothetical protein